MESGEIIWSVAAIVAVNVVAWVTPGPNMIAVVNAAVSEGRRAGVLTGLGLSAGAFIWAGLAMSGITVLFEVFPDVARALRLLGAAYLLWLGLKALHAAAADRCSALHGPARRPGAAFLTGLTVSLTNPKAALFFGSILTAFVPAQASAGYLTGVVLLCGLLAVCLHAITALLFSTPLAIRIFSVAQRRITAGFGIVFSGMGAAIACDALRR